MRMSDLSSGVGSPYLPRNARLIFQQRLHRVLDAPHLGKLLCVTGRGSIVAVVKQPMQTLQSPGSNGSAFLCNQDLGQVLNLVFFPDRVIEVERSEEHTSELQSLMRISYAVFCLKKKTKINR